MKTPLLLILISTSLAGSAYSQAPAAKPATPVPKLTAKDIRELPFSREFKETVFKANSRDTGDELRVTMAGGLHIYGKKRGETVEFQGRKVGHIGKVALMPVGARSGKLTVKVPPAEEVTYYYAVLETPAGVLDTKPMKLAVGKTYLWSIKTEEGLTIFRVLDGVAEVARLSGAEADVKGFGFAATVRSKGNEADLLATFD